MNKIIIKIFPRIHISLIAMHDNGYRKNGGFGFAIRNPNLEVTFTKAVNFTIKDKRLKPLQNIEIARAIETIDKIYDELNFDTKYHLEINGKDIPTHTGFGTSTAIRLAMIEALFILNDYKYSKHDIVKFSKRGTTSGIGINTYFDGGYVFDIGVKQDKSKLTPSSSENGKNIPLVIKSGDMPNWNIGICIPNSIINKTEEEELLFFNNTCPISDVQVNEVLYHILYGLVGSVNEADTIAFSKAINSIQKCTWKDAERKLYGEKLFDIEEKLYKCGACAVGMSSLGPTLFFLSENIDKTISKAKSILSECLVFEASTQNKGRELVIS